VKLDPGFKDAQTQLQTAQGKLDGFIADGDAKLKAGDIKGAIDAYAQAGGYQQADQKASAPNAKITRLDGLYGQMEANAKAGNWADALDEASSILSDTPSYRDVKAKRDGYLEQIYAAAGIAESQSDWKEVIRLYGILQAKEPNYKDVNEKLAAARIAAVPKPGTVVYEADWSKGLSGWTNTGGWRSLNGMLINDGSNTDHGEWKASWVPAPFDLSGMTNYAVEVEAQRRLRRDEHCEPVEDAPARRARRVRDRVGERRREVLEQFESALGERGADGERVEAHREDHDRGRNGDAEARDEPRGQMHGPIFCAGRGISARAVLATSYDAADATVPAVLAAAVSPDCRRRARPASRRG